MKTFINSIDRQELVLNRCGRGVILEHPDRSSQPESVTSLHRLLNLPFNVYFLNYNGGNELVNDVLAESMGFSSPRAALGKTIFDITDVNTATVIHKSDMHIMENKVMCITEEDGDLTTGVGFQQYLSIKLPWFTDDYQIAGVFGCSILLNKHNLADSLTKIIQLGLFQQPDIFQHDMLSLHSGVPYLSRREKACLYHLIHGKSAKQTGEVLGISRRTVETYLENLKFKFGVRTKSELIEKALQAAQNYHQA